MADCLRLLVVGVDLVDFGVLGVESLPLVETALRGVEGVDVEVEVADLDSFLIFW